MSDTDHHLRGPARRHDGGERIRGQLYGRPRRWHKLPSARDEIAEQLRHDSPVAGIVDPVKPRKVVPPVVLRPVAPVRVPHTRPTRVSRDDYVDHAGFREFCRSIPVIDASDYTPTPFQMARARQARLAS